MQKIFNGISALSFVGVLAIIGCASYGWFYVKQPANQTAFMNRVLDRALPLLKEQMSGLIPEVLTPKVELIVPTQTGLPIQLN